MRSVKCEECRSFSVSKGCAYDFRWAAGASGQAVSDTADVYFCQDYDRIEYSDDDE